MVTQLKSNGRLALGNTGTWAAGFADWDNLEIRLDALCYHQADLIEQIVLVPLT